MADEEGASDSGEEAVKGTGNIAEGEDVTSEDAGQGEEEEEEDDDDAAAEDVVNALEALVNDVVSALNPDNAKSDLAGYDSVAKALRCNKFTYDSPGNRAAYVKEYFTSRGLTLLAKLRQVEKILDQNIESIISLASGPGNDAVALAHKFPNAQVSCYDFQLEWKAAVELVANTHNRVHWCGQVDFLKNPPVNLLKAAENTKMIVISFGLAHHSEEAIKDFFRNLLTALQPDTFVFIVDRTYNPIVSLEGLESNPKVLKGVVIPPEQNQKVNPFHGLLKVDTT